MSASRSTRRPGRLIVRVLLVLAAAAAVVLLGLFALVQRRSSALQAGSAFLFSYQVTSTTAEPSLAYSTLSSLDALTGTITGESSGSDLHLVWYDADAAAFDGAGAPGPDEAFTDLYLKDGLVLLNVQRLYSRYTARLTAQSPLIASLVPAWALGDYISHTQLALQLGQEPAVAEMGHFSASAFSPRQMERTTPENGLDGYLYFTPKQLPGDASVTIGFPPQSIWGDYFYCHILVDSPSQGLHIELTGHALPGEYTIEQPASLMRDEDVAALADIIQGLRAIAAFVSELAG